MVHTLHEQRKLLARAQRIRGQVDAIERAFEGDAACEKIMHLLASTRAAMAALMAEVLEDHVRTHLVDTAKHPRALKAGAVEQLLSVVHTYLK
jgi:DNA-binding FrmR family transcriptional regulator